MTSMELLRLVNVELTWNRKDMTIIIVATIHIVILLAASDHST